MSTLYQRKRALIIGIDDYPDDSLKYCVNDANDLQTTLQSIDFDVSIGLNCKYTDFFDLIDRFVARIQLNDLTLFYFAGHGRQSEEQNFLLPADYDYNYRTSEEKHLAENAVNVRYITKAIDEKKCRFTVYLFDCCRSHRRTRAKNGSQGLSAMHTPPETLIIFSCAPGKAALDETYNGRNGIFTGILLEHIAKPHDDIEEVLRNVAREVKQHTKGFQLPYRTSSLTDTLFLTGSREQEKLPATDAGLRLMCHGRACEQCGGCRDWYQCTLDIPGIPPVYGKRDNVACCGTRYVYHDGHGHFFNSIGTGFGVSSICNCSDNI